MPNLSEVARKVVAPAGITATAWPAVRHTCEVKLGISFDPWQDAAGRLMLAKRADGKLACMIGGVGMSLPRQVGKTYLVGALTFALCINRPGMLVIWSAHHARTHAETFLSMQAFADRSRVKPYIRQIFTGSGDEEIRFVNGSRILFGARERGFGRGIPGVDMIISDEAQIMSDKALDAQLATMNVSQFGLAMFIGTPPRPDDPSESFTRMRSEAWSGQLKDAVWIEFGAEAGADPDDRKQWARANPSYPGRTPPESILRLRRKLQPDSFLREGLGIWDDSAGAGIFGVGMWPACAGPQEPGIAVNALALAVAMDQSAATISAAALGGRITVKPLQHGPGTLWTIDRLKALQRIHRVPVVVDSRGPAASLIRDLEAAGVRLHVCTTADVLDAWDTLYKLVTTRELSHDNYPELDEAVAAAATRPVGERTALGRRKASADVSALESVMLAAWWATRPKSAIPPQNLPQRTTPLAPTNRILTQQF